MSKLFKIFTAIIATIIILFGIGIFLLTHYVDPNTFKGKISAAVYRHTGHQLTINGNLSWSLFPRLSFKVTDAKIASPPGFNDTLLIKIGEADISIRLLPLFSGNVVIHDLELRNLQVNLIRNAQRNTNWQVTKRNVTAENVGDHTNSSKNYVAKKNGSTLDFSIANLTVVNSNIHWVDKAKQQSYKLNNVYIKARHFGAQRSFPLTITFNLTANKSAKTITTSLDGHLTIDDKLNAIAIHQLQASINNVQLKANLSVKDLKGDTNFQGDINIPTFNLRKLLATLNISLAKMKNAHALEKLSANMAFNGGHHYLNIQPLKLVIDNTTINGNFNVTNLEQRCFNFKLNADTIDIDNYLPKELDNKNKTRESVANHHPTIAAKQYPQHTGLVIQLLRNLNAQGSMTIHQLVIANLHLSKAQFTIKADDGTLNISPFSANLYQGGVSGRSRWNVQTTNPRYQFAMKIKDVEAQPLLTDLIAKNLISGTANFSVNLLTNGNSIKALINDLQGNGQFSFTNGTLNGINIDYQLARATALLHKKAMPNKPKSNTTTFGEVNGSIQLDHGVATNNDLQMTKKDFAATGSGHVNLNMASIDYELMIEPKDGSLKAYRIPLKISGMLGSPIIQLDSNDILQQVLQTEQQHLTKQVKQNLQKALGDLFAH